VELPEDRGNAPVAGKDRKQSTQRRKGGKEPVSNGADRSSPTFSSLSDLEAGCKSCPRYRPSIPLFWMGNAIQAISTSCLLFLFGRLIHGTDGFQTCKAISHNRPTSYWFKSFVSFSQNFRPWDGRRGSQKWSLKFIKKIRPVPSQFFLHLTSRPDNTDDQPQRCGGEKLNNSLQCYWVSFRGLRKAWREAREIRSMIIPKRRILNRGINPCHAWEPIAAFDPLMKHSHQFGWLDVLKCLDHSSHKQSHLDRWISCRYAQSWCAGNKARSQSALNPGNKMDEARSPSHWHPKAHCMVLMTQPDNGINWYEEEEPGISSSSEIFLGPKEG